MGWFSLDETRDLKMINHDIKVIEAVGDKY